MQRYNERFHRPHDASGPVLIIGGGRVGRAAARALAERGVAYRVIERDPLHVRDPETGRIVAGARTSPTSSEFADSARQFKRGVRAATVRGENTTLVVVATNARLNKVAASKLAALASIGMARTISPVWTTSDGDVIFALSLGSAQADLTALGVAASEAVEQAILRAARLAPTLGRLPGLAG